MDVPDGVASYAWVAAAAVVAPGALGFGLVRWLGLAPAHGLRTALGFGYVVGHYVQAHVTLAWLALGEPFPGFLLPLLAVLAGGFAWRRAHRREPALAVRQPSSIWSWLPCLVLVLWLCEAFTAANAAPLRFGDETTIWAAKAKVLYAAPGFDLREGLAFFVDHPDYPLLNPLAQVLAFASAGRVLHFENRLPIQFFGVALLLILSGSLARRAHPLVAALVLAAFASTSFSYQATTAFADVPLACCTLAAVDALLRWHERGDRACLPIACLAAGAMLQTKNEGSLLVLAIAVPMLVAVLRRRGRDPARVDARCAAWLLVPASAWALHRAFNAWYSLRNDLTDSTPGGRGLFARMLDQAGSFGGPVLRHYGRMLVDASLNRWLPLAFLIAALIALATTRARGERTAVVVLVCTFAIATVGYMLVFVGTTSTDVQWHLDTAADRTLMHVVPLAALGLAIAAAPSRESSREPSREPAPDA